MKRRRADDSTDCPCESRSLSGTLKRKKPDQRDRAFCIHAVAWARERLRLTRQPKYAPARRPVRHESVPSPRRRMLAIASLRGFERSSAMADLLQLVVSGTATGAIYALAALGFTLLWQASGTINFAQGEFVMVPAFLMLFFMSAGAPLWIAFLAHLRRRDAAARRRLQGAIVDPLIRHGVIPLVIATLGLSIGLKQLVQGRLQRAGVPVSEPVPRRAVLDRRRRRLVRRRRHAGARRPDRDRAAGVPQPHGDRARDAGGRAEHRRRHGARHRRASGWCSTRS